MRSRMKPFHFYDCGTARWALAEADSRARAAGPGLGSGRYGWCCSTRTYVSKRSPDRCDALSPASNIRICRFADAGEVALFAARSNGGALPAGHYARSS